MEKLSTEDFEQFTELSIALGHLISSLKVENLNIVGIALIKAVFDFGTDDHLFGVYQDQLWEMLQSIRFRDNEDKLSKGQ